MRVLNAVSLLLPPPRFLLMPNIGVDISESSLKYVQFERDSRSGKNLHLKHWGDIDIPEGTFKRGNVENIEMLSKTLAEVKKQTGTSYVRVSLPEERAYIFETEVKRDTPLKEIRGQLEFKLEENVPLSPRDAHFDYHITKNPHDKGEFLVSVTVYAKETIMGYYEACQRAGVTPLSFEVEAQAIARATIPNGDIGTTMIIDFGKTRTGVGIVHKGILMYTSTIDIGGKELSTALRRQLGDRAEKELTEIKNTRGLVQEVNSADVYEALVSTVSAIKDEIQLRIQYWDTRREGDKDRFISNVILCGGSANLKGLPGYLTETLGIETRRAQVWQNAFSLSKTIPPIGRRYSYGYATAIGLALTSYV